MGFLSGNLFTENIFTPDNVIAVYTQRESAQIASKSAMRNLTNAKSAVAAGNAKAGASASIEFHIEGLSTVANMSPQPIVVRSPGSAGTPPKQQATQPKMIVVDQLIFDVATVDTVQGSMQTVSYTFSSRQSIHQTASGYYVDEFGLSPGSINFDILVPLKGDIVARFAAFKSVLETSKLSNPLSADYPKILRYNNNYDGTAFLLTQARLSLSYTADRPNTLIVSIAADILQDYNAPTLGAAQASLATLSTAVNAPPISKYTPAQQSMVLPGSDMSTPNVLA